MGDTTQPEIWDYDVDMDKGHLLLTFDEPVNRTTMDVTQVTLSNAARNAKTHYTLTGLAFASVPQLLSGHGVDVPHAKIYDGTSQETTGGVAGKYGNVIVIHMTIEDLNEVK